MLLPLFGDDGSGAGHDWHNILLALNALGATDQLALVVKTGSVILFVVALGLAVLGFSRARQSLTGRAGGAGPSRRRAGRTVTPAPLVYSRRQRRRGERRNVDRRRGLAGESHRRGARSIASRWPTIEDDLFLDIGAQRAKSTKFWVQLVLASVIAAGGVIGNSTPAVIGAMIIAPLGTPIYGWRWRPSPASAASSAARSLLLVSGIAVNILIGVLLGLLTVNRMPLDVNPQIVGPHVAHHARPGRRDRGGHRRLLRTRS